MGSAHAEQGSTVTLHSVFVERTIETMIGPRRPPLQLERTAAARDRVRETMLATIPRWYSPYGHLAATVSFGLLVFAFAWRNVVSVRPLDLLVVPLTALLANFLEYRLHKY